MSKKTYTLELTAEELTDLHKYRGWGSPVYERVVGKLTDLIEQAKADREADELRLPWRAVSNGSYGWFVKTTERACHYPEHTAKLMSAAPELLEAVRKLDDAYEAMLRSSPETLFEAIRSLNPLVKRALRKVETGVPE